MRKHIGMKRETAQAVPSSGNRKARRAAGQKKQVRTYTLTDIQIAEIKAHAAEEAARKVFIGLCSLPLMANRDLWGHGAVRSARTADKIFDLYDSYQQGYITEQDCIDCLKDECGFDLIAQAREKGIL